MTFYSLDAAGFGAFVGMQVSSGIYKSYSKTATDERDAVVSRKSWLWAAGTSFSVVIALLVVLTATYMKDGSETISVYFPQFVILTGGVILVLTQAIAAVVDPSA